MLRIRPVFLACAALALGTGTLVGVTAGGARADDGRLCKYQVARVSGGSYVVQNNEWDSAAPECVTTDGGAEFRVANSAIWNATDGAPGAYPSIFGGCHWGDCTTGGLGAHPLPLSGLGGGMLQSSWSTTDPSASEDAYDVAYDIWINQTPTTSGSPDGTEVMVWLNHRGPVQPAGRVVTRRPVLIGGRRYDVWYSPGGGGGDTVSYEMTSARTGVNDLDIGTLINDAKRRGYTKPSWYLISVEAGFEIWRGGAGLATRSFSVNLMRNTRGWPTSGHRIRP
jgi:Glycosyl hydrolase family 12